MEGLRLFKSYALLGALASLAMIGTAAYFDRDVTPAGDSLRRLGYDSTMNAGANLWQDQQASPNTMPQQNIRQAGHAPGYAGPDFATQMQQERAAAAASEKSAVDRGAVFNPDFGHDYGGMGSSSVTAPGASPYGPPAADGFTDEAYSGAKQKFLSGFRNPVRNFEGSGYNPDDHKAGDPFTIPRQEFHSSAFVHKRLWPLNTNDLLGLTLSVLGLMIAAGGGIGGGGILVPLYILCLRFSAKYAIPLSNITIFGGSISNMYLNIAKRHPLADRPLVDWDLILVMEPCTIAGALIGSFLNKMLPEWLLTVLLVIVLAATARRTLKKAFKAYAKESKMLAGASNKVADSQSVEMNTSYQSTPTEESKGEDEEDTAIGIETDDAEKANDGAVANTSEKSQAVLESIYAEEASAQIDKVGKLCVIFVGVLLLELAKGGGDFSPLGIKCGTFSFWFVSLATLPWVIGWTLEVRAKLVEKYYLKRAHNYKYVEGDIMWDEKNTIKFPLMCTMAGLFAGMFGIGGGIVKGPLMLEMGVHPLVSSATSACMIFFTASTATLAFFLFGLMQPDYAAFLFVVGVAATYVGQVIINALLKKYKRSSYIIFSVGAVVGLSAMFMGLQGFYTFIYSSHIKGDKIGNICAEGE